MSPARSPCMMLLAATRQFSPPRSALKNWRSALLSCSVRPRYCKYFKWLLRKEPAFCGVYLEARTFCVLKNIVTCQNQGLCPGPASVRASPEGEGRLSCPAQSVLGHTPGLAPLNRRVRQG